MKTKGFLRALLVGVLVCAPRLVVAFCGPITWNGNDAPQNAVFSYFENATQSSPFSLLLYDVRVDGQCMRIWIHSSPEELQYDRWNTIKNGVVLSPLQPPCSVLLDTETEAQLGCIYHGLYYQLNMGWFFPDKGAIIALTRLVGLNDKLPCDDKEMSLETLNAIETVQMDIAKEIVDKKCCPPDKRIPMPSGMQAFAPAAAERPQLGIDPSAINPFGIGKVGENTNSPSLSVGFCGFERPVDILIAHVGGDFEPYTLESDNKAHSADMFGGHQRVPGALMTNVTGPVSATLSKDFGGLFPDPGHLPKGSNNFYVLVAPSPMNLSGSAYVWAIDVPDVYCGQGLLSLPEGQQAFVHQPVAKPAFGLNPAAIKPFQIGPAAIGGDDILMAADFCQFDGPVDVHFALYCDDDPANVYFLNFNGKEPAAATREDVLQKVPIASLRLPVAATYPGDSFNSEYNSYSVFFVGSSSQQPQGSCAYFAAVTPAGVRDKFYAWVVLFNRNIRSALIDFALKNR